MQAFDHYREIWAVDFEFTAPPGGIPVPLCVVARELRTGQLIRRWLAGQIPPVAPYPTDLDVLFVAYYASAELGCHLALGWPLPARILDLFTEFRNHTNGHTTPCGKGLLGALIYFGLDSLQAAEKDTMRQLALRGGPYTDAEQLELMDYCQSDVDSLVKLLPAMNSALDLRKSVTPWTIHGSSSPNGIRGNTPRRFKR